MKLWDVARHQEIITLPGHGDTVRTVTFSPDGRWLASAGSDGAVILWDVTTRTESIRFDDKNNALQMTHNDTVRAVAFSPDSKLLASASDDQTVKLWDVETRLNLITLKGHNNLVRSVVFSWDGRTLASASDDGTVKLWDVASRQVVATLKGNSRNVRTVAFSPDGRTLVVGYRTMRLHAWEVADCVVTLTHAGYSSVASTAGDFRKLTPLVLMKALNMAGHLQGVGDSCDAETRGSEGLNMAKRPNRINLRPESRPKGRRRRALRAR